MRGKGRRSIFGQLAQARFYLCKIRARREDIVQDVFLAYLREAPPFESEAHEKAWLYEVTANKSRNARKAGWFRNRCELPEELGYLPEEQSGAHRSRSRRGLFKG